MSSLKGRNKIQKIDEYHFSINVTGYACPYPQLYTFNALNEIPIGAELAVTLDNPPSVRDIPISLERKGYKVVDVSQIDGKQWKILIQATLIDS